MAHEIIILTGASAVETYMSGTDDPLQLIRKGGSFKLTSFDTHAERQAVRWAMHNLPLDAGCCEYIAAVKPPETVRNFDGTTIDTSQPSRFAQGHAENVRLVPRMPAAETKPEPLAFQYYQIRPCVETEDETRSFFAGDNGDGNPTPEASYRDACAFCFQNMIDQGKIFWTIYGVDTEGHHEAICDRKTFEAAYHTMNAILAPLGDVWRTLDCNSRSTDAELRAMISKAHEIAVDVCFQSSNEGRL